MANAIYPEYKEFLLSAAASVSLNSDTANDGPYLLLIDTASYTYSSTHDFVNDLGLSSVSTATRITTPTVSNGTFDGDNVTFTLVTGNPVEALVIYRNHATPSSATQKLVVYIDSNVTGLPVTPNGGDITVSWNVSGIFTL